VPVQGGLAGLLDVSSTCLARGRPSTQSRTGNDKKSNPYTKPQLGPIRGKLSGFKVAGCSDQPYCLTVVIKGWHVPQTLARTESTKRCG
jgi:hypothetical protein